MGVLTLVAPEQVDDITSVTIVVSSDGECFLGGLAAKVVGLCQVFSAQDTFVFIAFKTAGHLRGRTGRRRQCRRHENVFERAAVSLSNDRSCGDCHLHSVAVVQLGEIFIQPFPDGGVLGMVGNDHRYSVCTCLGVVLECGGTGSVGSFLQCCFDDVIRVSSLLKVVRYDFALAREVLFVGT